MTNPTSAAREAFAFAVLTCAGGSVSTGICSTAPGILLFYHMTHSLGLSVTIAPK